ncbi:hypothetical protein BH11PSE12_BH11PSE12_24950 [soil metagenome]
MEYQFMQHRYFKKLKKEKKFMRDVNQHLSTGVIAK